MPFRQRFSRLFMIISLISYNAGSLPNDFIPNVIKWTLAAAVSFASCQKPDDIGVAHGSIFTL